MEPLNLTREFERLISSRDWAEDAATSVGHERIARKVAERIDSLDSVVLAAIKSGNSSGLNALMTDFRKIVSSLPNKDRVNLYVEKIDLIVDAARSLPLIFKTIDEATTQAYEKFCLTTRTDAQKSAYLMDLEASAEDRKREERVTVLKTLRVAMSEFGREFMDSQSLAAQVNYRVSESRTRETRARLVKEAPALYRKHLARRTEIEEILAQRANNNETKPLRRLLEDTTELINLLERARWIQIYLSDEEIMRISTLNRRLSNVQYNYRLEEETEQRIIATDEWRQTREEMRQKAADVTIGALNYVGLTRNLSVGGLLRGVMAIGRGVAGTTRFFVRTAPSLVRQTESFLRSTPLEARSIGRQVSSAVGMFKERKPVEYGRDAIDVEGMFDARLDDQDEFTPPVSDTASTSTTGANPPGVKPRNEFPESYVDTDDIPRNYEPPRPTDRQSEPMESSVSRPDTSSVSDAPSKRKPPTTTPPVLTELAPLRPEVSRSEQASAVSRPASVRQPTVSQPTVSQPTVSQPTVSQPTVSSQPSPSQPTPAQPTVSQPAPVQSSPPVVSRPEPIRPEPVRQEPRQEPSVLREAPKLVRQDAVRPEPVRQEPTRLATAPEAQATEAPKPAARSLSESRPSVREEEEKTEETKTVYKTSSTSSVMNVLTKEEEIKEWNERVEARKAAKKEGKQTSVFDAPKKAKKKATEPPFRKTDVAYSVSRSLTSKDEPQATVSGAPEAVKEETKTVSDSRPALQSDAEVDAKQDEAALFKEQVKLLGEIADSLKKPESKEKESELAVTKSLLGSVTGALAAAALWGKTILKGAYGLGKMAVAGVGTVLKSALKFGRLGAMAIGTVAGYVADAAIGASGVLGEVNKAANDKADDANWASMSTFEKAQSGVARGIEFLGRNILMLDNVVDKIQNDRIKNETEYLKSKETAAKVEASKRSVSGRIEGSPYANDVEPPYPETNQVRSAVSAYANRPDLTPPAPPPVPQPKPGSVPGGMGYAYDANAPFSENAAPDNRVSTQRPKTPKPTLDLPKMDDVGGTPGVPQRPVVPLAPVNPMSSAKPTTSEAPRSVQTPTSSPGDLYSTRGSVNLDGMNPEFRSRFMAAIAEYKERGGKQKVNINRAFSSYEEQAELYNRYGPGRAAPPGRSAHEFGVAIDIDRGAANEMDSMGILDKHGISRPVRGEPWHLQMKGVSSAMARKGIFSADAETSQASAPTSMKSGGGESAPAISPSEAASPGTTSVKTSRGTTPEAAAYDPRQQPSTKSQPPVTTPQRGQAVAGKSSHSVDSIPTFSYHDPGLMILNVGVLT